MTIRRLI